MLALKMSDVTAAYTAGFICRDEAAIMVFEKPAGNPEPRLTPADKAAMGRAKDTVSDGDSSHRPSDPKNTTKR